MELHLQRENMNILNPDSTHQERHLWSYEATNPGVDGARAHANVTYDGGEGLGGVDVNNGERGGHSGLSYHGGGDQTNLVSWI